MWVSVWRQSCSCFAAICSEVVRLNWNARHTHTHTHTHTYTPSVKPVWSPWFNPPNCSSAPVSKLTGSLNPASEWQGEHTMRSNKMFHERPIRAQHVRRSPRRLLMSIDCTRLRKAGRPRLSVDPTHKLMPGTHTHKCFQMEGPMKWFKPS